MGVTFFFDTYAFHEIISINHNYEEYKKDVAIVTTKLNLMELYYGMLLKYSQDVAEIVYDTLVEYTIEIDDEIIKTAMQFRFLNKNKGFSYVDCIGYIAAKMRGIKFLTGDPAFKDIENVEFVE